MEIDTFADFIFPPAQIISSNSTISSKVLSERVLLSNNSILDMSCFLRASVLLSKDQIGTVHMANNYKLASILTIYINYSTRTEMKLNETGFRPPLCTYRLNWAMKTS